MQSITLFQDSSSQQHALCRIVPTLGRVLKAKQLGCTASSQFCRLICIASSLLQAAAFLGIMPQHGNPSTPNDPSNRLSSEQQPR